MTTIPRQPATKEYIHLLCPLLGFAVLINVAKAQSTDQPNTYRARRIRLRLEIAPRRQLDTPCISQPDSKRNMAGNTKISQQSLADLHAELDREAGEEKELKRKRKREKSSITFNKLKAKAAAVTEVKKKSTPTKDPPPELRLPTWGAERCNNLQEPTWGYKHAAFSREDCFVLKTPLVVRYQSRKTGHDSPDTLVFRFQCPVCLDFYTHFPLECLQDHLNRSYDNTWERALSAQQIEAAKSVVDQYVKACQPVDDVCAVREHRRMGYRNSLFQIKVFREDTLYQTGNGCRL